MTTTINASTSSGLVVTPDNSGNVLLQYNGVAAPTFSAYLNSNQSVTQNTYTKCQFNTEEYDTANCYDSATNYRFTPTVAGYYQVNACIYMNGGSYAAYNKIAIYKNGSIYKANQIGASSAIFDMALPINAMVYCNGTTDYVEIYGYNGIASSPNFGGTSSYQPSTYFQACLLRGA